MTHADQKDQDAFENIINNNGKSILGTKCFIDVPLSGEISLSVLKDKNVEELHFVDGKITRIYNVPRGIKTIVINNNQLESIPTMELKDLVNLEANNNKISKVDLKGMEHLHSLILNQNLIASVTHLPKSLHTLSLNKNRLKELNLRGCESCVKVSTLDNLSLSRIYNAPVTNHNFELKKDEHTQLDHKMTPTSTKQSDVIDVKQAVDQYYALQNKYATYKKSVIDHIMSNGDKTRGENIKRVRNTIFKCINCKQKGGTKFWKDTDNNLRAVCGNASTPCNLNFSILASLTMTADENRDEREGVENAKREIIQLKMDTLFGYVDGEKSIEHFKTNMEIINAEMMASEEQDDMSEQKKMITKKMRDVYGELEMIRKLKHEYQMNNNRELLSEMVSHRKNIKNNLDTIRSLKYPIIEVVQDGVTHVLKELPYSLDVFNPNLDLLKVNKFLR
jgi:hypothetical protein